MACRWTSYIKTIEICGEEEAQPATWWPLKNTDFYVDDGFIVASGDALFAESGDIFELSSDDGWDELPKVSISEAAHYNDAGTIPRIRFIIRVADGALASGVSITATKDSGETRAFGVEATSGSFALVYFDYDDPDDFVTRYSTYTVSVAGDSLSVTMSSTFIYM